MISWVIEFICLLPIAESLPRTVESFVAYFGSILLVYHFESSYYLLLIIITDGMMNNIPLLL